jgi:hypothetical protein
MKLLTLLIVLTVAGIAPPGQAQGQRAAFDSDFPTPDSPIQPDLTPGYALIEGDIQIPLSLYGSLTSGGIQPAATFGGVTYWADNLVPYEFATSGGGAVSAANQTAAINAMNAIAARAGVNFRAAVGSDANRVRFQNSSFNNSPVGVQGQVQIINIASWGSQIIICHEIYHSLGFWHEQSRPDRGIYITVNANNICGSDISTACTDGTGAGQCCACVDFAGNCTSCALQFDIRVASTYGPYDLDSIMHYGRTAFSCNGSDTITVNAPWNAQWQSVIGQRDHFSYLDGITCRALYSFPNDRWLDRAYDGLGSGTFHLPYNDTSLADALDGVPSGGTLLVKYGNTYSAVGIYSTPVTIMAPNGAVTLGN